MQALVRTLLSSHQVARPFGIPVSVHGTLVAFAGVLVLLDGISGGLAAAFATLVLVALLLVSVVVHELGHALAARGFGVGTRAITLLPIGGVAMLSRDLRRPRHELVVAIAGPAVSLTIAAFSSLALFVLGGTGGVVAGGLTLLLWINLMLGLFNLLPAFPMDGGRVLRAFLAGRVGRLRATRIAARLGLVVAVLLGVWGLFGNPMLLLIAVFVYFSARTELAHVEAEHRVMGPVTPGAWFFRGPGAGFGFYRVEVRGPFE